MNINIEMSELRKRRLFIATPMYGGQCQGTYTKSMMDLAAECSRLGIYMRVYFLFNESLITRGRNYCVDEFLRSDCTHLMFIDSDIGFAPQDVLALLALQSDESPYDVIGGAYPKKNISWEKIKYAVDKGYADNNPTDLEKFVGDYVFNPKQPGEYRIDEPFEVAELGTGFMMIRRATFENYEKAYPEYHYKPDHARMENFDGSREIMAYFDCIIDPESKRYLSEDYMFCRNVGKMGGKIWLCPWMKLQHIGMMMFGGSLADIAALGVSPTVDHEKLKKKG